MAVTADKVVVTLEARNARYDAEIDRSRRRFERNMDRVSRSARRAEMQSQRAFSGISRGMKTLAGALAAGVSVRAIQRMADSYTRLTNSLIAAGVAAENRQVVEDRLYEAASRNGAQVEALAQLYRRAALAGDALGATQDDLLNLTDGVAAALRVEGISAQEARGPLMQLGQALASPIVRAEELNSVLEGTPEIARAAARGFGTTVAELRKAILSGEVSNRQFFAALMKGLEETEKAAQRIPLTIGNSFQVLFDNLARYVGQADDSVSATERLSEGIVALSNNLDMVVGALAVAGTVLGARIGANLTASLGAEIKSVQASIRAHNQRIDTLRSERLGQQQTAEGIVRTQQARIAEIRTTQQQIANSLRLARTQQVQAKAYLELQVGLTQVRGASAQLASAKAQLATATRNLIRLQRLERGLSAELTAARTAEAAATQTAATRQAQYNTLLGRTGIIARATAGSMAVLRGAMAFLGGPIGAAITAVIGGMWLWQRATVTTEEAYAKLDRTIGQLKSTNDQLKSDQERLKSLSDDLAEAIKSQGEAAELTARKEIAALNERIAKNKELQGIYEAQARADLAAAEAARTQEQRNIERQYGNRALRVGDPQDTKLGIGANVSTAEAAELARRNLETAYKETIALQDAGETLNRRQLRILNDYAAIVEAQMKVEEAQKRLNALISGEDEETDREGPDPLGGGLSSGKTVAQLQDEAALAAARIRNDRAEINRLEKKLDLQARIAAYKKAEAEDPEGMARADQARIAQAEAEAYAKSRKEIAAATDLEASRLAENVELERSLQRQADQEERRQAYLDNGLGPLEAERQAKQDIEKLDRARAEASRRALADHERSLALEIARLDENQKQIEALEDERRLQEAIQFYLEQNLSETDAIVLANGDLLRIQNAQARARKQALEDLREEHRLAVARARGDEDLVRQLENAASARSYQRQLEEQGFEGDAASEARRMADELTSAQVVGEYREAFKSAFKEAVNLGIEEGDWGKAGLRFVAGLAQSLNDKALDEIADTLFEGIFGKFDAVSEGVAQGSAAAPILTSSVASGGAIAASSMSTAIVLAGQTAAASMAAAISTASAAGSGLGSLFGGFRATGGSVSAGKAYVVGEKRPEMFVPGQSGTIIPSIPEAMSGGSSGTSVYVDGSFIVQGNVTEDSLPALRQEVAAHSAALRNLGPTIDQRLRDNVRRRKLR